MLKDWDDGFCTLMVCKISLQEILCDSLFVMVDAHHF